MHQTLNTSLIYCKVYPICSNPCQNIKTTRKYFSWIFCIFTDICLYAISISILPTVWRFVLLLLPHDLILSWGSTYQLVGSTRWWVTLPIYTTIQSNFRWCLYPFLSSLPHHSQMANVSSQSVLPIIIINMSSNSIPLQLMSRWSLDSDDYDVLWNVFKILFRIEIKLNSVIPSNIDRAAWLCNVSKSAGPESSAPLTEWCSSGIVCRTTE